MATTPTSADQYQASQVGLMTLLDADVAKSFKSVDPTQLAKTLPGFIDYLTALLSRYGQASSTLSANYYEHARAAAGVKGSYAAPLAPVPTRAEIEAAVQFATQDLWTPGHDAYESGSLVATEFIELAETNVIGVSEKAALDSGRETLIRATRDDRQATGWYRVTRPGCCAFCALLSTRGAVYHSKSGADFQAHNSDRCVPAPMFKGEKFTPSPQVEIWRDLYASSTADAKGPQDARRRFRQAYEGRDVTPKGEKPKTSADELPFDRARAEKALQSFQESLPKAIASGNKSLIAWQNKRIAELTAQLK